MAVDLNMDMGALVKGLMAKHNAGGGSFSSASVGMGKLSLAPYNVAIIIFITIVTLSAVYVMNVYIPLKEQNQKKQEELIKAVEMKNQLSALDGQIHSLRKKLDKSKEQYLESLAHFGNSEDLGGLYQTVSTLALKYGLFVLNVKEVTPPPKAIVKPAPAISTKDPKDAAVSNTAVPDAPAPKAVTATTASAPKKASIDVREIKVEVELKGRYGEYIKFKEDLALAEILLKINSESIMVKDEKSEQGSIYVKLNISTYAIDKKPFQGIIGDDENEKTKNTKGENEKAN